MKFVKRLLRQDRDYFTNCRDEIRQQNCRVLRFCCVAYLVILAVYTVLTVLTDGGKLLQYLYYGFDVVHLGLCSAVFFSPADENGTSRYTGLLSGLLIVTVLGFFLVEAVFPYPDESSVYFPFPIILIVMLFVLSVQQAVGMIGFYVLAFAVLVLCCKAPQVRQTELYTAAGTLISSTIGYGVVRSLRYDTSVAMQRLRNLSMIDQLTSLYNKRTMESLCGSFMEDSKNQQDYTLLLLDVDNFKYINDHYGHPTGDAVLHSVAALLRESFYEKDYLGRFGGDEFLVFMVDTTNRTSISERLDAFLGKLQALSCSLQLESLSCSVGIAVKEQEHESYAQLVSRADQALYIAKRQGKGTYQFSHNPGQDNPAV